MTESEWTRKVTAALRGRNAMVFPIVASRMQPPGWPDRLLCHKYTGLCLLEFKGPDTKVSALQQQVIRELRARDAYHTFVVRAMADNFTPGAIACLEGGDGTAYVTFDASSPEAAAAGLLRAIQEVRQRRAFSNL